MDVLGRACHWGKRSLGLGPGHSFWTKTYFLFLPLFDPKASNHDNCGVRVKNSKKEFDSQKKFNP